ncbi:MAG: hypothetical protein HC898_07440 [Phycisphaerales bacterium]|nr:hypothetical protein [Phycisphaerales bacterium]
MNRSSSKRERVSSGKVAMMAGLLSALPGLATIALPGSALAVDVFSDWTSAVDGNWEDAGNWTPAQAPANGTDNYFVDITASGTPYTII